MQISLKTKMTLAVALMTVAVLSAVAFFFLRYTEQVLRDTIGRHQFDLVTTLAAEIDSKLELALAELKVKAETFDLETPDYGSFLQSHLDDHVLFDSGMGIFSPEGILLAFSPEEHQLVGRDFSDRDYIRRTLETGRPYISSPFDSRLTHGHAIVMIAAPVFDAQGGIACILAGAIDLEKDNFLGKISSYRLGEGGYLYLYDRSRMIIAHPDRQRILQRDVPRGANRLFDLAIEGFEGTGETVISWGLHAFSSFKGLQMKDWILAANLPVEEALAPVATARNFILGILLGGTVFSVLFSLLLMRHLTSPLLRLTQAVKSISAGGLSGEAVLPESGDEIGILSRAFGTLVRENRSTQKYLEEQLLFFQVLIDTIPIPIWFKGTDLNYLGCNTAFAEFFGKSKEEIVGATIFDLAPHELAVLQDRVDRDLLWDRHSRNYETPIRRHDGAEHDIIVYKEVFRNLEGDVGGVVGTFLDLTEHKRFEKALLEQREFSESLIQNSPVAGFVLDRDHRVRYWNAACEELTGLRAEQMVGTSDHWRAFYDHRRPCLADLILEGDSEGMRERYPNLSPWGLNADGLQAEGWFSQIREARRYLVFNAVPLRSRDGEILAVVETLQDLTDRKLAQEALQESEERLRALFDSDLVGSCFGHVDGRILDANDEFLRLLGYSRGDLEEGLRWDALTPTEFLPLEYNALVEAKERGACTPYEKEYFCKDGSRIWALAGFVLLGERREESVSFVLDLSERKRMELELLQSRDFYLTIFEEFPALIWRAGLDGRCDYFNRTWLGFTGRRQEDELGYGWAKGVHPEDRDRCMETFLHHFREREPFSMEYRLRRYDGEYRWILDMGRPFTDLQGEFAGYIGACFDITEQRRTLEKLKTLSRALEQSPNTVIITDAAGKIEYVNPRFTAQTGYSAEEAIGRNPHMLKSGGKAESEYRQLWESISSGQVWRGEFLNRKKSGQLYWESASISPILNEEGKIIHFVGVKEDITEKKKIQESQYRRRILRESASEALHAFLQTRSLQQMALLLGKSCADLIGARGAFLLETGPEKGPKLLGAVGSASELPCLKGRNPDLSRLEEGEPGEGKRKALLSPLQLGGESLGLIGLVDKPGGFTEEDLEDMEIFASTAALLLKTVRAEQGRQQMDDHLKVVQKFEAIGQLAGGVAHDFNNLLTVINGYSALLARSLKDDEAKRQDAEVILEAGKKAENLVRQLLAFSRKQVLTPVVLNLNELIANFKKLLLRLVRENIELKWDLAQEVGNVQADPGQMEQILINLVINARDAMPDGGTITVETADVALKNDFVQMNPGALPGNYVMFAVSDTGSGMPEEVRTRVFEPFFTTKEPGRGTGLGLSTVYGIVKQSGGYIQVKSQPGEGSAFSVFLPRIHEAAGPKEIRGKAFAPPGGKTILLVEDDPDVLRLTAKLLEERGLTVLPSRNAGEAEDLFSAHPETDLLLTDMVMPGTGGIELCRLLRETRPDLKVLFISGHGDFHGQVISMKNAWFLQKPFSPELLIEKIGQAVNEPEIPVRP